MEKNPSLNEIVVEAALIPFSRHYFAKNINEQIGSPKQCCPTLHLIIRFIQLIINQGENCIKLKYYSTH